MAYLTMTSPLSYIGAGTHVGCRFTLTMVKGYARGVGNPFYDSSSLRIRVLVKKEPSTTPSLNIDTSYLLGIIHLLRFLGGIWSTLRPTF